MSRSPITVFCIALMVFGCEEYQGGSASDELIVREHEFAAKFDETPIGLTGRLMSESAPLSGAVVEVQSVEATTGADGVFQFDELRRQTSLLTTSAPGHHSELVVVDLHRTLDEPIVVLEPIVVAPKPTGEARLLFGGDVSLGRRFLNGDPPIDRMPDFDPEAPISVRDVEATTRNVLAGLKPLLDAADFVSVNLETVVTDEPLTPFDSKPYVFFTLPSSVDALKWWGVDYVSLGNNHIYDYLEKGVIDTLRHLESSGMPHSGAGASVADAFRPAVAQVGEATYAMTSVITFDGSQYPITWTADDTRGGAAYFWERDRLSETIAAARAEGAVPIVNIHVGREYTELPTDSARENMLGAADQGASLVIGHHPHVPQGFEWRNGTLIAHSLGNLVFDQERLETVLGLMARVDVRGEEVQRVVGVPVYLENFHPRMVTGELADVFLRRIAWASAQYGAQAAVHQGKLWLMPDGIAARLVYRDVRTVVSIGADGVGHLDLRTLASPSESVASIEAGELRGVLGRDIIGFGDMEDLDVDADLRETSKWYTTGGSSFPCLRETHRGAVAICSHRAAEASSPSFVNFRSRIRTLGNPIDVPNKAVTLLAWIQGENAGRTVVDVKYYAPLGPAEFGGERALDEVVGSSDWAPLWFELNIPPDDPDDPKSRTRNARAMRVFIRHFAPAEGEGMLRLDDVAAVTWLSETRFDGSWATGTVHPMDFVRFEGPPGNHEVDLTFRRALPPDPAIE